MTERHQRRPRQPRAGRADRPELRLVVDRSRPPEGAARQRRRAANLARQIAAAVRDRGADGVNLDFEPIASGYADEFTALVRKVRASLNEVAKGYQLTFDTTGWIGNYPIEAATATGGADAVVVMGYDYRSSSSSPVGSIAPIGGPTYDIGDTIKAYVSRIPASKVILGVPYYGRAWSTSSKALAREEHLGHEVRRVGHGAVHDRARVRGHPRQAYDTGRGRRLDRLPARELHADLRLRQAVAPALLRRRQGAQGQVRPRQPATACAAPGSGRSATTARAPSCTRRSRTSSSPTRSRRRSRAARSRRRSSRPTATAGSRRRSRD